MNDANRSLADRLDVLLAAAPFSGVALIAWQGEVVLHRAYGHVDNPDARFRWCSITKQLTAVLVLRRVMVGALVLDAPLPASLVGDFLPNVAVTPRELLTHTSGLPEVDGEAFETAAVDSSEALVRVLLGEHVVRASPGAFRYNNLDFLVLEVVLERLSGRTFSDVVRDELLGPLNMARSDLTRGAEPPDLARGHLVEDGRRRPDPEIRVSNYGAAGALHGPARDLWRFDEALLAGALLPDDLRRALWTPLPGGFGALGSWVYDLSFASGETRFIVHRGGMIGGVETLNLLVPSERGAVILLSDERGPDHYQPHLKRGLTYELLSALVP